MSDGDAPRLARYVEDAPGWRQKTALPGRSARHAHVVAMRWRAFQKHVLNVRAETADDCHVVAIALRRINVRISIGGHVVQDGEMMPGMLILNGPGEAVEGLLRGPTEVLHLHVPNGIIAECAGHRHGAARLPLAATALRDPVIERLGQALLGADEAGGPFNPSFAESVSLAIVTRLLDMARKTAPATRPRAEGLTKWRLRRVFDYVDGNLAEPLHLADLASACGLTRMHFAAQFRTATGLRPHEYLLRRRIERAQDMLRGESSSIMDVALQVGFQTQAHFTATFRRFVGQPPSAWRRAHGP